MIYSKMKNEEKAKKRQEKVQEEKLQEKGEDGQMTEDMDVKIRMESQENEQQGVCTEISRGQYSENLSITGNTQATAV